VIGRYLADDGSWRELCSRPAAAGTVLVVDRDVQSGADERLLAHLAADEPPLNASLVCRSYLSAEPARRRCRALQPADVEAVPPFAQAPLRGARLDARHGPLVRGAGCAFQLLLVAGEMSIPALRWTRRGDSGGSVSTVSLREAIAELESYRPFCELTRRALARYTRDPSVSCSVLRAELLRVLESPIVLNRALREAVLAKVSRGEASMSELAMRCGRLKRDQETGEWSERPNYFDVNVYGPQGESVATYMSRGRLVGIDGRLAWREWETPEEQKRQAVSIVADSVLFLGAPESRGEEGELVGAGAGADKDDLSF
jgi:single stranded DNA-binding protein